MASSNPTLPATLASRATVIIGCWYSIASDDAAMASPSEGRKLQAGSTQQDTQHATRVTEVKFVPAAPRRSYLRIVLSAVTFR
jgi:hypothetical protein